MSDLEAFQKRFSEDTSANPVELYREAAQQVADEQNCVALIEWLANFREGNFNEVVLHVMRKFCVEAKIDSPDHNERIAFFERCDNARKKAVVLISDKFPKTKKAARKIVSAKEAKRLRDIPWDLPGGNAAS